MDAVIYCRISQDRNGEGLGVERQEADCRILAQSLGWNIAKVFVDNDVSAYGSKARPSYIAMLQHLATGSVGGLLSWHTDRLYRSVPDLSELVQVCEAHTVAIRTVKAGPIDLSTPTGRLNATMLASIARYEVERSAERIKSAKQQQALDGKFRGGPRPFGYEEGGMKVVTVEADAIRAAAEHFLRGGSLMSISKLWMSTGIRTARGNATWTASSVRKVLARARNAGLIEQAGKIVGPAQWPAIYDVDTLHAIRTLLDDPVRRTSISYERAHQGSGVYLCGVCGATMSVFSMGGRSGRQKYLDYRCSNKPHLSQRKEALDAFVTDVVIARLSREDVSSMLLSESAPDVSALRIERDVLVARMNYAAEEFAKGLLEGTQLTTVNDQIRPQIARIDHMLAGARESSPVAQMLLAGRDLRQAWEALSMDMRGKVIKALMTVTVMPVGSGAKVIGGGLDRRRVEIEWRVGG